MRFVLLILTVLTSQLCFSQKHNLILLKPTGNEVDSLTEMIIVNDTSEIAQTVFDIVERSFIKDVLAIHDLLQQYLENTTGKSIEPAYLALTKKQGGYARKGFCINIDGRVVAKRNSYYVDINESKIQTSPNKLMSITQLYPHELGHIMYRLLSSNDSLKEESKNVNVHFFSLVTDYNIAFNEGFAEHMENVSRLMEKNHEILNGISSDTIRITRQSKVAIDGFRKDFMNPLRIGFYKMTMLTWYPKFEDYKRFAYPLEGWSKYQNESISTFDKRNNLIYRNTGVNIDSQTIRNQVQTLASEGVISAFFTQLLQSEIKNIYKHKSFYHQFVKDTVAFKPEEQFTPLQNLFLKYFVVLNKYVTVESSASAQLIDFVDGYLAEFPKEEPMLLACYKKATGLAYSNQLPKPLWALVKDQPHGILALDPYSALTVPVYTFDINAGEHEDFLIIKGISGTDVAAIMDYRNKNGFFNSYEELYNIPNLSEQSVVALKEVEFDQKYFDNLPFPEELNIKSIIVAPVLSLVKYTLAFFSGLMIVYFTFIKKEMGSWKKNVWVIIKYFFLWLLFISSGLMIAVLSVPWYYLFSVTLFVIVILYFLKKEPRIRSILMTLMMTVILLISLM